MENAVRFTFARMTNRPKERCISGWRNLGGTWPFPPRLRICASYEKWVFSYRQTY